jgi:hypothetical protein
VDEQRKLAGNQTVVFAREGTEEESPVLPPLAMGRAPGARSVSVSVTAEAGGRAKAFFLGVLQEDFPVHRLESAADTVLLVRSEVAIAAMAVALAVVLIGSCVRHGWWDDWRASRGRSSEARKGGCVVDSHLKAQACVRISPSIMGIYVHHYGLPRHITT